MKGNKGEWSETYVFVQAAIDGKIPLCDVNLNPVQGLDINILKIFRENFSFEVDDPNEIKAIRNNGFTYRLNKSALAPYLSSFLQEIKDAEGSSFNSQSGQFLLNEFQQSKIKAGSKLKKDIAMQIIDPKVRTSVDVGFSIKSEIGRPPSLGNASQQANFVFEIVGGSYSDSKINSISSGSKIIDRVKAIKQSGASFRFSHCEGETYTKNLRMIDSQMPELLAWALLSNYMVKSKTKTLKTTVSDPIFLSNVSGLPIPLTPDEINYKFKTLLSSVALGMVPNTPWSGIVDADGGYIVMRSDGKLVCFHVYNLYDFQNYLFENVKFESSSSGRHGYGSIYSDDGKKYFKVNCQIRFLAVK